MAKEKKILNISILISSVSAVLVCFYYDSIGVVKEFLIAQLIPCLIIIATFLPYRIKNKYLGIVLIVFSCGYLIQLLPTIPSYLGHFFDVIFFIFLIVVSILTIIGKAKYHILVIFIIASVVLAILSYLFFGITVFQLVLIIPLFIGIIINDYIKQNGRKKIDNSNCIYCRECGESLHGKDVCMSCGVPAGVGSNYCNNCGNKTSVNAVICVKCKTTLSRRAVSTNSKSKIAGGLLGLFLGGIGIHDFYLGYTGKGIAHIVLFVSGIIIAFIMPFLAYIPAFITSIWGLVDGIRILVGAIDTDAYGDSIV